MTGDRFVTALDDGLLLSNADYTWYRVDPTTWEPVYSNEQRVDNLASVKKKPTKRKSASISAADGDDEDADRKRRENERKANFAIVVSDSKTWLQNMAAQADAKYAREGERLEDQEIHGRTHQLWSGIQDGSNGARLRRGQPYTFPLKDFPIVFQGTDGGPLKQSKQHFHIQKEKAPNGHRQSLSARFVALAVLRQDEEEVTGSNRVTEGYLVVRPCLLPGITTNIYLRLHGALRDIKPLNVREEITSVQKLMPFEAPLVVEIQNLEDGSWAEAGVAAGQDVTFAKQRAYFPAIRLKKQNTRATSWSLMTDKNPL
jgi:hypothetical protein